MSVLNLPESFLEVVESKRTHTEEVQDRDGCWHELSIHPYRTLGSSTDGAVLVLMDIDQRKRAAEEARAARDYAEAITWTVRELLIVVDDELRVVTANRAFYALFETNPDQTEGRLLFELSNGHWNLRQLQEVLEGVLKHDGPVQDFEVDRDFERLGRKILLLNARCLPPSVSTPRRLLLSILDVTAQRLLEVERAGLLAQSEARGKKPRWRTARRTNF